MVKIWLVTVKLLLSVFIVAAGPDSSLSPPRATRSIQYVLEQQRLASIYQHEDEGYTRTLNPQMVVKTS